MKINKILLVKAFLIAVGIFQVNAVDKANASMLEDLADTNVLTNVKLEDQKGYDVAWLFRVGGEKKQNNGFFS